ncbi:hypothetical protein NPIL_342661 [Nephila pilipes]|uniref:Uncharacterized protein n=1 Tax=Nephila pilipes TaxID=299642 RepID=A0A8X6U4E8_NEPPI|nr:hypothetical protein NPIL_342661 [Nephila pilipes]
MLVRPMFDATTRLFHHSSLNQRLQCGLNLIEFIPDHLLRFRDRKFDVIDRSCVGSNDMEAPRQSSSRGPVACFWSTNRKQNTLLWAPKKHGANRQLPTPPNE